MGSKFKLGDRVIYLGSRTFSDYKQFDRGTVIKYTDLMNLVVKFDNGYKNAGQDPDLFEFEEVYNSPLYKLMKEHEDEIIR